MKSRLPSFQNALALAVANGFAIINVVNSVMSLSSGFSIKGYKTLPFRLVCLRVGNCVFSGGLPLFRWESGQPSTL
jgi:hypothetical protein